MTRLRLGTRGSTLATTQARWVAELLRSDAPELDIDIVEIRTSGDSIRQEQLGPELGQGFFTKEIEDALLAGRIDVAVHSCKDLGSTMPEGLELGAVPTREDPYDALVSGGATLDELPAGATLGTSSVRRQRFLALSHPHLVVQNLRGNVPTRVRAVDEGRLDGVVVAAAGLHRLGLADRIAEVLTPPRMVPAAAQGALALQVRHGDEPTLGLVRAVDHAASHAQVRAERACLRRLAAGCQAPVGVLARAEGDALRVDALVAAPSGPVRAHVAGSVQDPESLGTSIASDLLRKLELPSLRDVLWASPPPRSAPTRQGMS